MIRQIVSYILIGSLFIANPGVAGLIEVVARDLNIHENPESFSPEERFSLVRIFTRDGEYFTNQENAARLLKNYESPITLPLSDRVLELRRFDRYDDPSPLSGYLVTREFEEKLWGIPSAADIWFFLNVAKSHPSDPSIYGLEVRSLMSGTISLKDSLRTELLSPINPASLSRVFISSVLFLPRDGRLENFHLREGQILSGRAFEDVNPSSFSYMAHGKNAGKHEVLVQNSLYLIWDFLNSHIDDEVKSRVLGISPELLVVQWLTSLTQFDFFLKGIETIGLEMLAEKEILQAEEEKREPALEVVTKTWNQDFYNLMIDGGFPVYLKEGIVGTLVEKISRLQSFLRKHGTHREVINEFDLISFLFYSAGGERNTIEDVIGDHQFPGVMGVTVSDVLRNNREGPRKLLKVSDSLERFFSSYFTNTLSGFSNLGVLNAMGEWFYRIKPLIEPLGLSDVEWDDFHKLLLSREISPKALNFGQALGFDLNRKLKGWTLLHNAAWHGRCDYIETLLDLGALPDIQGKKNLTPLDCVVMRRKILPNAMDTVRALVFKGAGKEIIKVEEFLEWYREEKENKTPLDSFFDAFRVLAKRHQKFGWLVTLEDVFPKLVPVDDVRGQLVGILKRAKKRSVFDRAIYKGFLKGGKRSDSDSDSYEDEEEVDLLDRQKQADQYLVDSSRKFLLSQLST